MKRVLNDNKKNNSGRDKHINKLSNNKRSGESFYNNIIVKTCTLNHWVRGNWQTLGQYTTSNPRHKGTVYVDMAILTNKCI